MPWIAQSERPYFNTALNQIEQITTKGQLEYCIFYLMLLYMDGKEYRYSNLHDVVYAAIHCGDEFRRLYLDVREDKAREKNGDIILDDGGEEDL